MQLPGDILLIAINVLLVVFKPVLDHLQEEVHRVNSIVIFPGEPTVALQKPLIELVRSHNVEGYLFFLHVNIL
jgi:uncharacterized radical SAM superfamily Fe-S cluster-containing enzyme